MAISDLYVNSFRRWSGPLEVYIVSFRGMPNTVWRGRFPWGAKGGFQGGILSGGGPQVKWIVEPDSVKAGER